MQVSIDGAAVNLKFESAVDGREVNELQTRINV